MRLTPKERKKQILQAAIDVALRDGYINMTRDNVAIKAGVSMGLVNQYFGTMLQLKRAVMRKAVKDRNLPIIGEGVLLKDPVALKQPLELIEKAVDNLLHG